MNWKMVFHIISLILFIEAILMSPSLLISLYENEARSVKGYVVTLFVIVIAASVLFVLTRKRKKAFQAGEGLVTTGLTWVIMSMFGCLPFVISGEIPSFVDAFFEIVSGFTTTGSSILKNVETLDKGLLWWRSFSHWIGGMGVLVFMMAIVPLGGKSQGFTMHILKAESPGPSVGKVVPRMKKAAMILYGIYIGLTILNIALLYVGGMNLFEACCHAFGTAGTGGFGIKTDSFASYSPYLQYVTAVFMLLFSLNFAIYYLLLMKHFKIAFLDEELRVFLLIVAVSIVMIVVNIHSLFPTIEQAFRHAFFTVSTIISTTGYATVDFNHWPAFSKGLILVLMCLGACAGSTGGGIKTVRLILLAKSLRNNLYENMHPEEVTVVNVNHRPIRKQILNNTQAYLIAYLCVVIVCFLLISLDGFDVETNFSAILATFNNIGPGLGLVGPSGNFSMYSNFSKLVLSFAMLAGRLEIYPMLIFFAKKTYRKTV